ncbi:MAG TPA: ribonuclease III [Anaerolineae bacterium]|nr:ribonuclease III [Anaerolineae bacterium]HQK13832.1 ribonuclease III [Anaerolineae bacterium]
MVEGENPLLEIQKRLNYHFTQLELLELALTHPSYAHEHPEVGGEEHHNQRLEFLGDAVVNFLVAAWLYRTYPDFPEGPLTRLRATLVCTTTLASLAQRLGLGEALRLGRGEQESGGQTRVANLCDAMEALVGALYLDGGLEAAWQSLEPWFVQEIQTILHAGADVDAKSRFQEWAQAKLGITPAYRIVAESGPDHAKLFTAQVLLRGQVAGEGQGSSKRLAEQSAAQAALNALS